MKKALKFISKLIMYMFVITFVLINFSILISTFVMHKDYPVVFGYTYFEIATGSMRDEIKEHDVIIVKLCDDYQVGDVITYRDNNVFVTHRIISIDNDIIVTKGDANNKEDRPIKRKQVLGKVVLVLDELGIIIRFLTSKSVIVTFILFIALISFMRSMKESK